MELNLQAGVDAFIYYGIALVVGGVIGGIYGLRIYSSGRDTSSERNPKSGLQNIVSDKGKK